MNRRFRKAMKAQKPFYDWVIEQGLDDKMFGLYDKTKQKNALSKKLCKETLSLLHKMLILEIGKNVEIECYEKEHPYYLILKMPDEVKICVLVMGINPLMTQDK